MLTDPQLAILRADITADPAFVGVSSTSDGDYLIAAAYNLPAVPDFWIWRANLSVQEMISGNAAGPGIDWDEYRLLAAGFQSSFLALTQGQTVDTTQANIRSAFSGIFTAAGSPNSRANLIAMARRKATRIEKLFAVGTGSPASPAIAVFVGSIGFKEVGKART